MMQALVLKNNKQLEYTKVPIPTCKADECLIKVKAAGICNSDFYRAFENGAYFYPLIMGHEFSGTVEKCGTNITKFSPGNKVAIFPLIPCGKCDYCIKKEWILCTNYNYYGSRINGGFAEYVAVKEWNLILLPDNFDLEAAALCEPVAVANHAFNYIKSSPQNKNIIVIGAGFIGLTLAKIIKKTFTDSKVWIMDRNQNKLEIAKKFNLETMLINQENISKIESYYNYFDTVIEACGAVQTFKLSAKLTAPKGQLLWLGNIQGNLELPKKEVSSILRKELTIQGIWNSVYQPGEIDDWQQAINIIKNDSTIKELVSHFSSLQEAGSLLADIYQKKKNHQPHDYLKGLLQNEL